MKGKRLVNLRIAIEEVEELDGLVRVGGYYGHRSGAKSLAEGILRTITRFVDESVNLNVRNVVGKRMNGTIMVNLHIAADGIESVDALSVKDLGGAEGITIKEKSSASYRDRGTVL